MQTENGKIRLYHTGLQEIRVPDIRHGRKNADFGQGFYLTTDREFAYRWAAEDFVLNEYELDTEGLVIKEFTRDIPWFEYIFGNRRSHDPEEADVIIGPIANDTLYDTLGIITSGFLTSEQALRVMKIGPEYVQAAVKTEKAAAALRWLGAEKIADVKHYKEILKKEEEEFQRQFAEVMEKITEEM